MAGDGEEEDVPPPSSLSSVRSSPPGASTMVCQTDARSVVGVNLFSIRAAEGEAENRAATRVGFNHYFTAM